MAHHDYDAKLRQLQIKLVTVQRHVIASRKAVLIILEGRDGAGKDGTIKRITEHLSPRDIRVVALPKPSDTEARQWYFQRYAAQLPAAGEIVIFNRSWYNRAGVERVMGFCSDAEYRDFLIIAPQFEALLAHAGITLLKYYLDIDREEQRKRLEARREDPLKQWKISPIDEKALAHFDDYTKARDAMLLATHSESAPWSVVRADDKKAARLAVITDLVARLDPAAADHKHGSKILQRFSEGLMGEEFLAS
jgi:polyphosphate kinase 2